MEPQLLRTIQQPCQLRNASFSVDCQTVPDKPKIFRPWEASPKNSIQNMKYFAQIVRSSSPFSSPKIPVHQIPPSPARDMETTVDRTLHDSGYHSDNMNSPIKCKPKARALNPKAVELMEHWYKQNLDHPYPSHQVVKYLANVGGITITQVKKWMANKRVRSYNTLMMNGSPHPNRMKKLQNNMSNIQTKNADLSKSPALYDTKFPAGINTTTVGLSHQLALPLQYFNWLAVHGFDQKHSMLEHHSKPISYYGKTKLTSENLIRKCYS